MREEKVLLEATLCFLRRDDQILLALKTKKIGMGCLNGYGGGVEAGEDKKKAAVRELFEETDGVIALPEDLRKIAEVYFHNTKDDGTTFVCRCHVYELWRWKGKPKSTAEMADPTWFSVKELPLIRLMPADPDWLPMALNGKKIIAMAQYGPFQRELLWPVVVREVEQF